MLRILLSFGLVVLAGLSAPLHAQISVSRTIIEFAAGDGIEDVDLVNRGDFRIFLDLELAEIVHPERDEPERRALDDPRTAPVLVSPAKLVVAPGERRRIRIIRREVDGERERIYRLALKPSTGGLDLGERDARLKRTGIQILLGYDLLIMDRPETLQPKVVVSRRDDRIRFENRGNTNVLLREIRHCPRGVPNDEACIDLPANRLYVDETLELALPPLAGVRDTEVRLLKMIGNRAEREIF